MRGFDPTAVNRLARFGAHGGQLQRPLRVRAMPLVGTAEAGARSMIRQYARTNPLTLFHETHRFRAPAEGFTTRFFWRIVPGRQPIWDWGITMLFWLLIALGVIVALVAIYFAIFLPMMKNPAIHD
jgi:hypothetical protein